MANRFYGSSIQEHAEKDAKEAKPIDWIIFASFFVLFFAAGGCIITGHIGIGIILYGLFFMMFHIAARVIFHFKSRITPVFLALGLMIILGGVLVILRGIEVLMTYIPLVVALIWLSVGIVCWRIGSNNRKLRKKYSRMVEAKCMLVDAGKIRTFSKNLGVNQPNRYAQVNKPAFQYTVDGEEYYVESPVYYGDLNKEFQEGALVQLLVDPKKPQDFIPEASDSVMETTMGVFGIVLGGGGLIVWSIMLFCGFLTF